MGKAIPNSPHAVSVALPNWEDVIAYEEKDPKCMLALQSIYPRFGLNRLVEEIAHKALHLYCKGTNSVWPYPNLLTATAAKEYCEKVNKNARATIKEVSGLHCLIVDDETTPSAKAFWQHTGLGASSRQASIALNKEKAPVRNAVESSRHSLLNRIK